MNSTEQLCEQLILLLTFTLVNPSGKIKMNELAHKLKLHFSHISRKRGWLTLKWIQSKNLFTY